MMFPKQNNEGSLMLRVLVWTAMAMWSLLMLVISIRSGTQHDYNSYISQWHLVLSGANPWSADNAYGPLHNLLAYLVPLGVIGPKMFIVATLLAANALLFWELSKVNRSCESYAVYLLAVPTNFIVISIAFVYALNDALVAALIVFAVVARCRGYLVVAGCFLGLAALLKYYPIVLVPLFSLDLGRLRFRLIAASVAVFLSGIGLAVLFWGNSLLGALDLAINREPKILSILSALSAWPFLAGGQRVIDFLVKTNVVFVAAASLLILLLALRSKVHWLEASVIGLLMVLTVYKVGHQQFYLPWLFLVASLPLAASQSSQRLALTCIPMILFLSAFQWGYAYGSDRYHNVWSNIRRDGGFFAFTIAVATIAIYFFRVVPASPGNTSQRHT